MVVLDAIPTHDPNVGLEVFGTVGSWAVFGAVILAVVAYFLSRRIRRRREDSAARAMVARDKEREQFQVESLRGIPDIAPFETYATEWEWEQDLRRKSFMGYSVLELNRFPYGDGDNEVQVQWQGDPQALRRAKRELERASSRR